MSLVALWSRSRRSRPTLPQVVQVYHLNGRSDLLVHVAVRDADHLRDLALSAFTARPEVARIETTLVFAHHRRVALPLYDTRA